MRRGGAWRWCVALGPAALVSWVLFTMISTRSWSLPVTIEKGSAAAFGLVLALASAWIHVKVPVVERPRALAALWSSVSVLVLLAGFAAPELRYTLNPLWAWLLMLCLLAAILSEFSWWRQVVLGLIAMGAWTAYGLRWEFRLLPTEAALGAALAAVTVTASRGGPGLRGWLWIAALPLAVAAAMGAAGGAPPFQCAHQGAYDPLVEFNDAEWWRHAEFVFAFRASGALLLGGLAVAMLSRRHRHLRLTLSRDPQRWFRDALPAPALLGVFALVTCSEDATAATYAERIVVLAPPARPPVIDAQLDYPEYRGSSWPALVITSNGDSTARPEVSVAGRTWIRATPVATAKAAAQWARDELHDRAQEDWPPSGTVLVVEPDVTMASVFSVVEELRAVGVERLSLAYFAPLPQPLAPALEKLQPRLRHEPVLLMQPDELACDALQVSEERLQPSRTGSRILPSRILVPIWLITSNPKTTYGEFLERLATGRDDDPRRAAVVLVPPEWWIPCVRL